MFRLTKNPTGPDLALIKEFATPWDRQSPPVFVGRKTEFEIVEENCRRALDLCRQGKKTGGHIVVFRGAPGAGKSSLLEHVEEHWSRKTKCPKALNIGLETLEDTSATALEIVKKIAPKKEKLFRRRLVTNTSVSGSVPGVASGGVSTSRETAPEKISFSVLKELMPPKHWRQPLCILVDEIQKVTERHGNSLLTLHLGEHGLPIVLVCAGLANSAEKMQQAMSPRLSIGNMRTLAALPPDEAQSCVKQMFDLCRINYTSDQLERIADGIATRSEGWPQHVRTETAALFGGLAETQGDLGTVDFAAVERQADAYREDSYLARQSAEMDGSFDLVAGLLRAIPETGMWRAQVVDIIREKEVSDGPESWRLPKGMDAVDFLDHLIHQGVLQPDRTKRLSCPIPSLQTWLIKRPEALLASFDPEPDQAGRGALETTMNKAPEQFEPDQKLRAGPDQVSGAER